MNRELTHHSFKKFHIVIDDVDDDNVKLILESDEENGFGIIFTMKILLLSQLEDRESASEKVVVPGYWQLQKQ